MKNKFTLIELLVVIVIIGILLSLGITGASAVFGENAEAVTRGRLTRIELAMEQYKGVYGNYYENILIKDDKGKVLKDLRTNEDSTIFNPCPNGKYDADSGTTRRDGRANGFGKYKFCSREENAKHETDSSYIPVTFLGTDYSYNLYKDGWNNFFQYVFPGNHNEEKFDLWSRGPDGEGLKEDEKLIEDEGKPVPEGSQGPLDDINNWSNQ